MGADIPIMTRPTIFSVLFALTLVAAASSVGLGQSESIRNDHQEFLNNFKGSASVQPSAPAWSNNLGSTPALPPHSAPTPASPSAPASGPTSCSGSDSGSAQDDPFSKMIVTIVNVTDARPKVKRGHYPEPKRGHYPERKPENETINVTIVNVTDARQKVKRGHYPERKPEKEPINEPVLVNEPVLDYTYPFLITLLVVFVGFGLRIRHLMVRGKTSATTPMTEEQIREYLSTAAPFWDISNESQRRGLVLQFRMANPTRSPV